jgi:undecaprenyl-phosphate 4-deoxy-4-formamido-L-arabinose transferase
MYIYEVAMIVKEINRQGVSVVIPCYNSEQTLGHLLEDINLEFKEKRITKYEIILVLDGPRDGTLHVAINQQKRDKKIIILELNKNFGQHAAIFAGLEESKFNFIVTMDDDGQHPVKSIYDLLAPLCGEIDVVYGVATREEHNFVRSFFSRASKYLTFKLLNIPNAKDLSAFRGFKKITITGTNFKNLTSGVVDVVLHWNTNKFLTIKVEMSKRTEGKSNYNFYTLSKFAIQMITGYSVRPLRISTMAGILTFLASFVLLTSIAIQAVRGEIIVAGYASLSLFVLFLGSIQLLTLGLIGEYLGKVHELSMGKPHYLVKQVIKP